MRKSVLKLSAFAVTAALLTASHARADTSWNYTAEAKSITGTSANPVSQANSSIDFIPAYGGGSVDGSSSIIVYTVKTNTTAPSGAANAVAFDSSFTLPVTIIDLASQGAASDPTAVATGTVNLNGTIKADNVTSSSFHYISHSIDTTAQPALKLGSASTGWFDYVVQAISFTPPGVPVGDKATGSIYVSVSVTADPGGSEAPPPPNNPPPLTQTPEPTSLLLAGLGLPFIVIARRRKAQAEKAAAAV